MKFEKYNKYLSYSYSLGAFPTLELIKYHKNDVLHIFIHSSFNNIEVIEKIKNEIPNQLISYDDKMISKLSNKENIYIIGIFNKYKTSLDSKENHILLDSISNMGNLGTIIRSSLGFNVSNLALVNKNIDYFDPKVIRGSMGAIFAFNIEHFNSLNDYKNKFNEHKIYSFMLQAKNTLQSTAFKDYPLTLAFGNEASGLPNEYLNENSVIIKHNDLIDSLNITNAVTIGLYKLFNDINKL